LECKDYYDYYNQELFSHDMKTTLKTFCDLMTELYSPECKIEDKIKDKLC